MSTQFEYEMKDGNRITALGLGTWTLRGERCIRVVGSMPCLAQTSSNLISSPGTSSETSSAKKPYENGESPEKKQDYVIYPYRFPSGDRIYFPTRPQDIDEYDRES